MRAAREQPRLVIAKSLGLLAVAACGVVLGLLLGADSGPDAGHEAARTTQLRLISTERTLRGQADELHATRARLERARSARARTAARLRATRRANATLRRDLRRVRRALIRARARS